MDDVTLYSNDGKEFTRKLRKFGDICLTDTNDRIFVCAICKCVCVTPTMFWKHQRELHKIHCFEDSEKYVDCLEHGKTGTPYLKLMQGSRNNSRRTLEKMFNEATAAEGNVSEGSDLRDEVRAPILQQALRVRDKQQLQQLYAAFEAKHDNDDNFDAFISYCCPECGKRFDNDASWKQHTHSEHNFFARDQLNISLYKTRPDGSTVYKCDVCNVQLNKPNTAPLRRHKLTHMPYKSFCCRLCDTEIRHKSGIVHHMRTVHRKGRKQAYSCAPCQKQFYSETQYKKHYQQHVDAGELDIALAPTDTDPLDMDADDSDEGLVDNNNDDSTMSQDDAVVNANDVDDDNDADDDDDDDDYDPSAFLVTEMTEDLVSEDVTPFAFAPHIKEEPPEEIIDNGEDLPLWQADVVDDVERRWQRAEDECELPPTQQRFECDVCKKCFITKSMLAIHLRTHGTNMDCRLCGVKISSLGALRRHRLYNRCKATLSTSLLNDTHEDNDDNNAAADDDDGNVSNDAELIDTSQATASVWQPIEDGNSSMLDDDNSLLEPQKSRVRSAWQRPAYDDDDDDEEDEELLKMMIQNLRCKDCGEMFKTEYSLGSHSARRHDRAWNCRLCRSKISSGSALRRHFEMNRCKVLRDRKPK